MASNGAVDHGANKYYVFECTVKEKVLSFAVDYPKDFFSKNTVVLATVQSVPIEGFSNGCNAAYAGFLLFAAIPFLFFVLLIPM